MIERATDYQNLMWKTWKSDPFDQSLVLSYSFSLEGNISPSKLEKSLPNYQEFSVCSFFEKEGVLFKEINNDRKPSIVFLRQSWDEQKGKKILIEWLSQPFDLEKGPLSRFYLIQLKRNRYIFGCSFSHIVFDGLSWTYFARELSRKYLGISVERKQFSFPAKTIETKSKSILFWKDELKGKTLNETFPFFLPQGDKKPEKKMIRLVVDGERLEKVEAFLTEERTTLFRFLTGAFLALAKKYLSSDYLHASSFLIGHTVSNREEGEEIGCYMNPVPLIVELEDRFSPIECTESVALARRKVKPHQRTAFWDLMKENPQFHRDQSYFHLLVNESPGIVCPEVPNFGKKLKGRLLTEPILDWKGTLGLTYGKAESSLILYLDYDQNRITNEWIEDFSQCYLKMIDFFTDRKECSIRDFSLEPVVITSQASFEKIEELSTVLFQHLEEGGDKIALAWDDGELNYHDLNKKVEETSRWIISHIGSDQQEVIGIFLERSPETVITILAILRAGHAFLPLDISLPKDRFSFYFREANCRYIISNRATIKEKIELNQNDQVPSFLLLDEIDSDTIVCQLPSNSPNSRLAYIIFTSGSTGNPKGVKITRDNLSHFLIHIRKLVDLPSEPRFLATTSINFDISLLELLLPITLKGTVRIGKDGMNRSGDQLAKCLNEEEIDVFQATPTTWRILKEVGWKPKHPIYIFSGGEPLTPDIGRYLLNCSQNVFNLYGPTEATIWVSGIRLEYVEPISIGLPFPGNRFYILGNHGLCALGQIGELCIAGASVGDGYSDSPFVIKDTIIREPYYKTGDRVVYMGGNKLIYLGRKQTANKLRGYRISLDEIQKLIEENLGEGTVQVVIRKKPDEHLVCFFIGVNPGQEEVLKEKLASFLPEYMIPESFYFLKVGPQNINSKIDRKALEEESLDELLRTYGLPTKITKTSSGKGSESFQIKKIIEDEFGIYIENVETSIGEYGLRSISIHRLVNIINQHFKLQLSPQALYEYNSVAKITSLIQGNQTSKDKFNKIDGFGGDVSIIGMSGVFPGAPDLETFWYNLIEGKNCISSHQRPYLSKDIKGGFLDKIEEFDSSFFKISPLEAEAMDPQQRMLLEKTWHALEDAGIDPSTTERSKVGVYVSSTSSDYWLLQNIKKSSATPYTIGGFSNAILANRLSYFFNWTGPSLHIDTACSGSLAAFSRACRDLSDGKCDLAVVGASNLILSENYHRTLEKSHFLSPNFRCATLDRHADGYVRGEGVVCLVLKRDGDIDPNNDYYYGKVESIGENHTGRGHSLTAPSRASQTELLLQTYTKELAEKVTYLELHGTGTELGDPIEIDALKEAWTQLGVKNPKVFISSLKTQIGHLEAAAGLASLVKVLLCFRHGSLPQTLHYKELNPHINLDGSPFYVISKNTQWETKGKKYAGVSSFGFGGSNVHVVLSEGARSSKGHNKSEVHPFCISAKSITALNNRLKHLLRWVKSIKKSEDLSIEQLAYSLNTGRAHFQYRTGWTAKNLAEVEKSIEQLLETSNENTKTQPSTDIFEPSNAIEALEKYLAGDTVNWNQLYPKKMGKLNLPLYPFDHSPFWFEQMKESKNDELSIKILGEDTFKIVIPRDSHPWLRDHFVDGKPLLPGVAYLQLVYSCLQKLGFTARQFINVNWLRPLFSLGDFLICEIHLEKVKGGFSFRITSSGNLCGQGNCSEMDSSLSRSLQAPSNFQKSFDDQNEIYNMFKRGGINYGPFFKNIKSLKTDAQKVETIIELKEVNDPLKTNLLDCSLQSILGLGLQDTTQPLLPFSIGQLYFSSNFFLHTGKKFKVVTEKHSPYRVTLEIYDLEGNTPLIRFCDVGIRQMKERVNKVKVAT